MRDPNSLQEVRRHVSSKSLGIDLPPGYHVLDARFRLILCFGDTEVRAYSIGAEPKQIERDAARHAARQRMARPDLTRSPAPAADPLTGLPWTSAVSSDAAAWVLEQDLHAVCIHLMGLDILIEAHGPRALQTVLREAAQALKQRLTDRDRLTRHSGDKLLIFTTRPMQDVEALVDTIHDTIPSVAVEVGMERFPQSRIGVASLSRTDDPAEAGALIEALVISAEAASTAVEPLEQEAPAASPQNGAGETSSALYTEYPEQSPPAEPTTGAAEVSAQLPPTPEAVPEQDEVTAVISEFPKWDFIESSPPVTTLTSALVPPIAATPPAPVAVEVRAEPSPAHPAPPPEVESAHEAPKEEPVRTVEGAKRLALKRVSLDLSGQVATALVELILGDRRAVGKTVGRDGEDRRLLLIAEATARAVTEFLPRGYGVTIHHIQHAPAEVGNALWSVVFFLTPTEEQSLMGIAPANGDLTEAAVNSVLNALNRRIGMLISENA